MKINYDNEVRQNKDTYINKKGPFTFTENAFGNNFSLIQR